MAKGGILGNPVLIGALTASITWYLLDEVLDDSIEKLLGKKKKNKGHKRVKMIKNKFGEVYPVVDDDESGAYFGAYERAWY
jgi:hypothetical protein